MSLRNKIQYKFHQQARFPRIENCIASRIRNKIVVPTIRLEYYKKKRPGIIFFVFNQTDPREQQKGIDPQPKQEPITCFLDYDINTTTYRVWERCQNKFVEYTKKEIDDYKTQDGEHDEPGIIIRTNETEFGKTLFIVRDNDLEEFRNRPTNG